MATMTKINLRPLGDRVIVQAVALEEKSAGGVFLPDSAQEKPQQGHVVAVGKGALSTKGDLIPMSVSEGDKVLYGKYAGTEVKLHGEKYLIIKESEILAILGE